MSMSGVLDSRETAKVVSYKESPPVNEITGPDEEFAVQKIEPTLTSLITEVVRHCDVIEGVPLSMLELYADIASRHATKKQLNDGSYVTTVAGLNGAFGEGSTPEKAVSDLKEAIVGWVVVKRRIGATDIPPMEGLNLNLIAPATDDEISAPDETA